MFYPIANEREVKKKREEKIYLDGFLKSLGQDAEIITADSESPDFVLRYKGQMIGLEISRVYISDGEGLDTLQARESQGTKILFKAQRAYKEFGGLPVLVQVVFHPGYSLSKLPVNETAKALASLVKDLRPGERSSREWRPEDTMNPLPDEITYIRVLSVPNEDLAHWSVARGGWAASLTSERLQERIDEKSKRLPVYQQRNATNWLLLVVNSTNPSQLFKHPTNPDEIKVESPFSKTFLYLYPENQIYEL